MRRRISLYINGQRADLADDALVLFNYAQTDLYNPSAIRNGYSHDINLPGTPDNDKIFGHVFRTDRRIVGAVNPPALLRGALRSTRVTEQLTWTSLGPTADPVLGYFTPPRAPESGDQVDMDATFYLTYKGRSVNSPLTAKGTPTSGESFATCIFVQGIGYDKDGNKIAATPVQCFQPNTGNVALSDLVTATGFTPDPLNTTYATQQTESNYPASENNGTYNTAFTRGSAINLQLSAADLYKMEVKIVSYYYRVSEGTGTIYAMMGGSTCGTYLYYQEGADAIQLVSMTEGVILSASGTAEMEPEPDPPTPPDPPDPPEPDPPTPDPTPVGGVFNPSQRTPFTIYDELGEKLVEGYCKMTRTVIDHAHHTYALTLFGSLGDFMWNLAQDADGNRLTLASLDYGLGGGDTELDFEITAQAVADAWDRLAGDTSKDAMWDVINFAPCYNGIPDKDFHADKALAVPSDLGLTVPSGMSTASGYTLISTPNAVDEWAAKDLRSYLQRPVLSTWQMLLAMQRRATAVGWTLDLSDIDDTDKWPYRNMWLTRPLLPSLGSFLQSSGGITVTPIGVGWTASEFTERLYLANVPTGSEVTTRVAFKLAAHLASAPGQATMYGDQAVAAINRRSYSVLFIQLVGRASDNTIVAASSVQIWGIRLTQADPAAFAAAVGYTPRLPAGQSAAYENINPTPLYSWTGSGQEFVADPDFSATLAARNVEYVDIVATPFVVTANVLTQEVYGSVAGLALRTDRTTAGTSYNADYFRVQDIDASATSEGSAVRSGAQITKQMLLSTDATPADYLVAICKTFGLYMLADNARKRVSVLRRGSFYQNTTTDLSKRIDRSHEVELDPLAFDARWYDFKHPATGGAFEKEYQDAEGVQYGIQRVNTNYDFDASSKDLLSGIVLKAAAAVKDRGPYWNYITQGGKFKPSPFLDAGCKYTLWDSGGESQDYDIPQPGSSAVITYYNASFPGYDFTERAEFRDAENKPVDGADVLLLYSAGASATAHFRLTDDLPVMDTVAGGPCWIFASATPGLAIPKFSRYRTMVDIDTSVLAIAASLDFGVPRQMDIPNADYPQGVTVYAKAWRDYIHDRLHVDNKVLRCRVLLDGLQVGPELFRRFWWWRGSLWVLNKISNYSLTTFDPAECEFIQVRDKDAYLNGQY